MGDPGSRITLARRGERRLATDPVCGMKVDEAAARGSSYDYCRHALLLLQLPLPRALRGRPRALAREGAERVGDAPRCGRERDAVDLPDGPAGRRDEARRLSHLRHGPRAEAREPTPARNPELDDMLRRFRAALALTLPLVALAMGAMLPGHPFDHLLAPRVQGLVELLLATPVVLWCGWPFFERMWAELAQRTGSTCSR